MSKENVVFLPPNTTSHIQPLNAGIIANFKAKFRKIHVRWIVVTVELDSGRVCTAEKARPDMRQAIEWSQIARKEVTATTIQNCWKKVELLPTEARLPHVTSHVGPPDTVMQELQDLLNSFASTLGEHLQAADVCNWPEEEWTAAPEEGVEDSAQEEDAELARVLQEREELDEEDADDSVRRVPMTLKEARTASEAMKTFVQENLREHPELQEYKDAVEGLNRLLENMAFSARSKQTTMLDHFPVVREEGGGGEGSGGPEVARLPCPQYRTCIK